MNINEKLLERNIEYFEDSKTKKRGLRDIRTGEVIIDASTKNGFTVLLPSRRNAQIRLPIVATYNKYGDNATIIKGVIRILGVNKFEELYLPDTYNFVDGFEGGLARVYKYDNAKRKKWGIVGIQITNGDYTIKELVSPQYDNLWNFYDKRRTSIPAVKNGSTEDISLTALREIILASSPNTIYQTASTQEKLVQKSDLLSDQSNDLVTIGDVTVKNFKKFIEPTSIDLSSRITFIVGKNNAGKSSFLDAVEMMTNNMYDLQLREDGRAYFCFDNNKELEHQNDLFQQYRNIYSDKSESVIISIISGSWKFEMIMNNSALIDEIRISNIDNQTKIIYKSLVKVEFTNLPPLEYEMPVLNKDSEKSGLVLLLDTIWEHLDMNNLGDVTMAQFRDDFDTFLSIDRAITTSKGKERIGIFASIGNKEYVDNGDFVSNAILNYYEIDNCTVEDNVYHKFVCKWLERMDMGKDFAITKHSEDGKSDFYSAEIVARSGKRTDLCDMGSGTIHFVAICFTLLSLVDKHKGSHYVPLILIEEPEQNLHPMLQSHMANFLLDVSDLFAETYKENDPMRKIGLKIIVETHSEYIIRRSQILAKRFFSNGKINPFRVYYFPTDGEPYDMEYREDGRFQKIFGEGFTDESSSLAYQLI